MRAVLLIVTCLIACSAGCGRHAVRPDEKEHLAAPTMRMSDDDGAMEAHVLSNREGSTGGGPGGAGGCGCN